MSAVAFIESREHLIELGLGKDHVGRSLIEAWAIVDGRIQNEPRQDARRFLLPRWVDVVTAIVLYIGKHLDEAQEAPTNDGPRPA